MKLIPASWDLVPQILEILKRNGHDSKTSYNELNGHYFWLGKDACPEMTLLTPGGQVDEYGTFAFVIPYLRYEVHVHTTNQNVSELAQALLNCPHIDWHRSPTISCLHERLNPLLDMLEAGLPNAKRDADATRSFHIPKEVALKLEITVPDDVVLKPIGLEYAELINSVWPHGRTKESLREIETFLKLRPSRGLFKKDTGELVAWCLYGKYGGPGQLQTAEKHKRKGYGEIVLIALTKIAAENAVDPHAFIVLKNEASMALFKKVGYSPSYTATWTHLVITQVNKSKQSSRTYCVFLFKYS